MEFFQAVELGNVQDLGSRLIPGILGPLVAVEDKDTKEFSFNFLPNAHLALLEGDFLGLDGRKIHLLPTNVLEEKMFGAAAGHGNGIGNIPCVCHTGGGFRIKIKNVKMIIKIPQESPGSASSRVLAQRSWNFLVPEGFFYLEAKGRSQKKRENPNLPPKTQIQQQDSQQKILQHRELGRKGKPGGSCSCFVCEEG